MPYENKCDKSVLNKKLHKTVKTIMSTYNDQKKMYTHMKEKMYVINSLINS